MISNFLRILIFVFIIWQSFPVILLSQTADYIDGKVINSATNEPVPFATVQLKNHQLGVYANADGDFRIVCAAEFQSDSVIITCIGFKRYSLAYTDLNFKSLNNIPLAPVIYGLSEIKILASGRKLGSLAIIGRAIKNIKDNYPAGPFNYVAYFRDYQKRDGKYLNLNEAIIQALDNGFESKSITNKYRLLDFRENTDFPRMNISPHYQSEEYTGFNNLDKIIPWATLGDNGGNELLILMVHDAIRNFNTGSFSFINIFSEDFIHNHNFSPPVSVYDNNLLLFKIVFNGMSKVVGDSLLVSGAIYIQPKYYSIHKLEYSCFYKIRGKGLKEMFNVDIEYGHENTVDSPMRLKYVSFNNIFDVVNKDDSTCLRVLEASLDTTHYINPTVVVAFNNKIDPVTASRKDNYEVMLGKKTLKIKTIQANGKTVFLRMKDEDFKKKHETCRISIHNVKDSDGNILDKLKSIELYQYREMFVQEYNKNLPLTDSCFVKYIPLEQNCISKYSGNYNYWMNTPEKIK